MANQKSTALAKPPSEEMLAALAAYFPAEEGYQSVSLPRIRFVSQDITEDVKNPRTGKKEIKLLVAAGTFFQETQTDEVDEETGRPKWDSKEIGESIDLQIVFKRNQLKYFDEATKSYVSSNVFDHPDEIVTLYANKSEIAKGNPADLKKEYEAEDKRTGKVKSLLEDHRVLYVLYEGVLHQMNLRGGNMYAWKDYQKKTRPSVPAVITHIESEPKENGTNKWNGMIFSIDRMATADEVKLAAEAIKDIMESIVQRKTRADQNAATDREFDNFGKDKDQEEPERPTVRPGRR